MGNQESSLPSAEQPQLVRPSIQLPTKEIATSQQLDNLLSVVNVLRPFLYMADEEHVGATGKLDGGARQAATASFITLCSRIDQIVEDNQRWDIADCSNLLKKVNALHDAQIEFTKAQTRSSLHVQRPSMNHRPTLIELPDGYAAYIGDPNGLYIVGKGATPAAAYDDFDEAFFRTPSQQIRFILDKKDTPAPQPEDTAETPEQFNKRKRKKK